MPIKTFAAINVGSYEISMKIFEMSAKYGMKEIDHIRYNLNLGSDTFTTSKISNEKLDELCRLLKEFSIIMHSYKVSDCRVYGTSAIRETENTIIILEQIRNRTGLQIGVLSNSEQRFLDYKSIASKGEKFDKIIEKGTAIVDIGGGSIQISLFDKDALVTTQNIRIGNHRLREKISKLTLKRGQIVEVLDEMISNQLGIFKKLYLKDREINHIILVDDYISPILQTPMVASLEPGLLETEKFKVFVTNISEKSNSEIASDLGIEEDHAQLLFISSILMSRIFELTGAELLWAPGVTLCDGIAYEYAEDRKLLKTDHLFEQDILACARNISKRFMGSKRRGETLEKITLTIFDSMKKIHGLGKRERLLMQIASLLHDCGKFISLSNVGECSHNIIMATEMIGLSHCEREIVANVVKYNHDDFIYYEEMSKGTTLDIESYLKIAKLTAILRVANGLDRSHKQKFRNISARIKEDTLVLTVEENIDITLEKGLFESRADFFEEVYNVRPIINQKRKYVLT